MGDSSTPSPPPQEGGRVAVVCNMVSVVTDLSVTELLCQGQAEVISATLITDGLGLVRGRRDDDFVAHCALVDCPRILQAPGGQPRVRVCHLVDRPPAADLSIKKGGTNAPEFFMQT